MPLQNRVDPFGAIHAVDARGMFTGNRGVIHDPETRTLLRRRWTTKAWLVCACKFRGRRRVVMGRNAPGGGVGWTELFFLDEVTALAAGHRPCFYCRRARAEVFVACFGKAFSIPRPRVHEIDVRLHAERLASGGTPVDLKPDEWRNLPDGAVIAEGDRAYAVRHGSLLPWSFEGYGAPFLPGALSGRLVTPPTMVAVLSAGYEPVWHPSATS